MACCCVTSFFPFDFVEFGFSLLLVDLGLHVLDVRVETNRMEVMIAAQVSDLAACRARELLQANRAHERFGNVAKAAQSILNKLQITFHMRVKQ